jgi:hypothetical protein
MKKPKKIIIAIVITITLAAIFYFLYTKFLKPATSTDDNQDDKPSPPGTKPQGNKEFPLKQGSKGLKVKQLQAGLNIKDNAGLDVDGIFGPKTEAALEKYYKIKTLSEYNYDKYVKPYLKQINAELNKSNKFSGDDLEGETAYAATNTQLFDAIPVFGVGDVLHIGEVQGFEIKKDDPATIDSGELAGIVEMEQQGFYLVIRPSGDRVFILKSQTNIL